MQRAYALFTVQMLWQIRKPCQSFWLQLFNSLSFILWVILIFNFTHFLYIYFFICFYYYFYPLLLSDTFFFYNLVCRCVDLPQLSWTFHNSPVTTSWIFLQDIYQTCQDLNFATSLHDLWRLWRSTRKNITQHCVDAYINLNLAYTLPYNLLRMDKATL